MIAPSPGHTSPPSGRARGVPPGLARLGMRQLGRRVLSADLPWQVQRRRLDRLVRRTLVPRGTTFAQTVINGVPSEVVTAAGVEAGPTVVHFHGGGYCVGSALMARTWAARLSAGTRGRVVVPEYRLAPEHPYPAGLDDARAVVEAVISESGPASTVVSGDSAGAGLALSVMLARRDGGQDLPAGCIQLSPWADLGRDLRAVPPLVRRDVVLSPQWLEACATAYTEPSRWADPLVSPLLASLTGLPPLLIQAGTDELLAPDAERLAARASADGLDVTYTIWPRMWHDFTLQPGLLAAASSALSQAVWFVATVTSAP